VFWADMGTTMLTTVLALGDLTVTWYLMPLAAVISLVYNASRYELPSKILARSLRLFFTILLCMGAMFAALWFLSFGL
jgi:prolipoprotein diacylglyceryltransferase